MKKTMKLGLVSILLSLGTLAQAESYYRTFTDNQNNKVTLAISNQRAVIGNDGKVASTVFDPHISDVTVNGKELTQSELSSATLDNKSGEVSITSAQQTNILIIPAVSQKGEWTHKKSGQFSDGDTRIIMGKLIINGNSVEQLIETYESE